MKPNKFHLIFVDDEEDLRDIFTHLFEDEVTNGACDMNFFCSASECLEYLSGHYDPNVSYIVVSDINMPGMNGIKMLEEIQQKFPQVVGRYVMSAYDTNNYREETERIGVMHFFNKPINLKLVKKTISDDFGVPFTE